MVTVIENRDAALEKANQVRIARAQIKRDIRTGVVDVRDVLRDMPEDLEGMQVLSFLMLIRWVGRVKALTMLRRVGVSPARLLGALTDREVTLLVFVLGERTRR